MKRDQLIFLGVIGAAALIAVIVILATGGDDGSSSAAPTKPEVDVPSGPPLKTLQTDDITVGDGAEAQAGDTITVEYVGVLAYWLTRSRNRRESAAPVPA